jgi:hypothetical protein
MGVNHPFGFDPITLVFGVVKTDSAITILLLRRGFNGRQLLLFTDSLGLSESIFQLLVLGLKVRDETFRPSLR